jgi:hypothetical protein
VPTESVQVILGELREDLSNLMTVHGFACMGLRRMREYFDSISEDLADPDPAILLENVVPDNPAQPKNPGWLPRAEWSLSEAIKQVQDDGPVEALLGQQWIISVYALWEEGYRPRLAKARGRRKEEEKYALLGDLRRLRNDVIHHRGIATPGNTGRCEVLNWFQPGQLIQVDGRHFDQFLQLFPWSHMEIGN